jgi:hypothetical protein
MKRGERQRGVAGKREWAKTGAKKRGRKDAEGRRRTRENRQVRAGEALSVNPG